MTTPDDNQPMLSYAEHFYSMMAKIERLPDSERSVQGRIERRAAERLKRERAMR